MIVENLILNKFFRLSHSLISAYEKINFFAEVKSDYVWLDRNYFVWINLDEVETK